MLQPSHDLGRLAFFDVRKLFNSDGSPKQIHELDDETAPAISSFEVIELFEGTGEQKHCYALLKKFKLADKGQNLERLGRYHKLFTDKVEVAEEVNLAQIIADARKRVANRRETRNRVEGQRLG